MGEVTHALDEVKGLYSEVFGTPAPEIPPSTYAPFPPGADPVNHVMEEIQQLKRISEQLKAAPPLITWVPRADTFATRDAYVIRLEMPAVSRESLKVFLVGSELIVRGDRRPQETGEPERRALAIEWAHGPFERRFALPSNCRVDRVSTLYSEGVLELRIPIEAAAAPKEMKVEIA
jgi:HSP20 family protein